LGQGHSEDEIAGAFKHRLILSATRWSFNKSDRTGVELPRYTL
jgi:hypothetical protein